MEKIQLEEVFTLRSVAKYGEAHPQLTAGTAPETVAIGMQFVALKGVIGRVENVAAERHATKANTSLVARDEQALRAQLVAELRSIATVAKGLRGVVPGISILAMPETGRGVAKLIDTATGYTRKAAVYEAVLAEHGLPQDIVAQLERATDAVRQSRDARRAARSNGVGGTRSVKQELKLGKDIVKTLDGSVSRLLRSQPSDLAAWKSAKRVQRRVSAVRQVVSPVQSAVAGVQSAVGIAQTPVAVAEKAV
jgi:hypothetical protein